MAKKDYSEDLLIQVPTAELLEKELGWKSVFAQAEGEFGPESQLSHNFDYGVGDDMDDLLANYGFNP